MRHIVHGVDDVTSLLDKPDEETRCQIISSFLLGTTENSMADGKDYKSRRTSSHSANQRDSSHQQLSRMSSGTSVRNGSHVLKTSADSGCSMGCGEDKVSPQNFEANCHFFVSLEPSCQSSAVRKTNSNLLYNQLPAHSTNTPSHDTQDDNNSDDSSERTLTYSGKKPRQVSQYDNMSPVRLPLKPKDVNTDTSFKLNNLNNKTDSKSAKMLFAKSLTALPSENVKSTESENLNIHLNIADARRSEGNYPAELQRSQVVTPMRSEGSLDNSLRPPTYKKSISFLNYEKRQLAFPAGRVKNLKWIKLGQSDVGELVNLRLLTCRIEIASIPFLYKHFICFFADADSS